jgi:hypothetical protein
LEEWYGTIPYDLVILSFFYDDALGSVTKVWQKFTQELALGLLANLKETRKVK